MATVVRRYRRSSGLERDRMRWLLWSVIVMALAILTTLWLSSFWAENISLFLVMILPAVAMTIAIVVPGSSRSRTCSTAPSCTAGCGS